tara:strand:- start:97047 stop:97391 length:345 start_codon:yes stop_codon:yes gene_type:complete
MRRFASENNVIPILVIDRDNVSHHLEGTPGQPLMYVLRDANLEIEASCGGCCICATCHVYLEDELPCDLPAKDFDEELLLEELLHANTNSRLACQISLRDSMKGLTVRLAPAEL